MSKLALTEIFYSLQGEGTHTGTPAIFVRFSRCNLRCPWCDTDYSIKFLLTPEELASRLDEYPAHAQLVLTGGEPSMVDFRSFIPLMKVKRFISMETNGTNLDNVIEAVYEGFIDWITVSPKLVIHAYHKPIWCHELKVVLDPKVPAEMFEEVGKLADAANPHVRKYIQPCSEDFEPAIKFVKEVPGWRLSIQTQKLINVE